jgi:hypothetical protein
MYQKCSYKTLPLRIINYLKKIVFCIKRRLILQFIIELSKIKKCFDFNVFEYLIIIYNGKRCLRLLFIGKKFAKICFVRTRYFSI